MEVDLDLECMDALESLEAEGVDLYPDEYDELSYDSVSSYDSK